MEYADNGTLRKYLKKNFENLTWNDECLHGVHSELIINLQLMIVVMYFKD